MLIADRKDGPIEQSWPLQEKPHGVTKTGTKDY
jgi:hypothetical protein